MTRKAENVLAKFHQNLLRIDREICEKHAIQVNLTAGIGLNAMIAVKLLTVYSIETTACRPTLPTVTVLSTNSHASCEYFIMVKMTFLRNHNIKIINGKQN